MKSRAFILMAMLAVLAIWLISTPGVSQAQMVCTDCHQLHNSPGAKFTKALEFDLICDTCHGPAGTAKFVDRHIDPLSGLKAEEANGTVPPPLWEFGCSVCHTPHKSDAVNQLYNNNTPHAHTLGADTGNLVDGINIKLVGRNLDGTDVAKIATPLRIISVANSASCPNSNTDVQVNLPPFSDGEGPPHTIMVGDRITIVNSNAEFDGTFRVKETDWTTFQATSGSGWVCFDRPTAATYSGNGFVMSAGWNQQPTVRSATWASSSATLLLNGVFSIRVGDNISVSGIPEVNPGTFNGVKTVSAVSSSGITTATWSANTAILTLADSHLYQVGDIIVVSMVISGGPGTFNGEFTVTAVAGLDVSYTLPNDPGAYINNGVVGLPLGFSKVAYASTDPGATTVSGGWVEYLGSVKTIQNLAVNQPAGPPPYLVTGASWTAGSGNKPGTALLTLDRAHPFASNDIITVSGVISSGPGSYNGTYTITNVGSNTTLEYDLVTDAGTYSSGGEIPDPTTPAAALDITLTTNDANIVQLKPATTGVRDGDIITVYGANPTDYNGHWEVTAVTPPTVTVRCPPYFRTTLARPGCSLAGLPAYVGGGTLQSTGSMRPVVFESRGADNTDARFLTDYTHSFTNTDEDQDGWMDGPCETCHTQTANHKNDDFGNTHNNGKTCTASCHTHSVGFDKAQLFCPIGRVCPPVN